MNKLSFMCIVIMINLISLISWADQSPDKFIDVFSDDIIRELTELHQNEDAMKYQKASQQTADAFILKIFDEFIKNGDYYLSFSNLEQDEKKMRVKVEKGYYRVRLDFSLPTIVIEDAGFGQDLSIHIYQIPHCQKKTYYIFYEQIVVKSIKSREPRLGPEMLSLGGFRIIQLTGSGKYKIIARYEDTNFVREINEKHKNQFRDANSKIIATERFAGMVKPESEAKREYFFLQKNGDIHFTTFGGIPPSWGSPHCKSFETDWVFTCQGRLYATEFRWDIKELEYDMAPKPHDENGNPIMTSTVIKLKP